MDLAVRLRTAREAAGLTLGELSARTKIAMSTLRALEAGAFERLPGEFYTRAFLKTYAREVGLSADEVTREYDLARVPETPATPLARSEEPGRVSPFVLRLPRGSQVWAAAAVAVLLLIAIVAVMRYARPARDVEPAPVGTAGNASTPAPAAASTLGQTAAPPEKLTIEIRPTAPVWVAATADGRPAVYRLLKPGEVVLVEARDGSIFRVGDAGAFAYTINGVPGRPLGGPGEVREFKITRENYQTFRR